VKDSNIKQWSSLQDIKKIKCLYKKLVTCGIRDSQTACEFHSDFLKVKDFAETITNRSVEELRTKSKYQTPSEAKEAIEWLQGWIDTSLKDMCSIADRRYCEDSVSRSCDDGWLCKDIKAVAAASIGR